jgi:hypothetical protein
MKGLALQLAITVLTFMIGVAASIAWLRYTTPLSPCEEGKMEAKRDMQNSKLVNKYFGKKGVVTPNYQGFERMEKEYGITSEWVGDSIDAGMKAYCYNLTTSEEFEKRMGKR